MKRMKSWIRKYTLLISIFMSLVCMIGLAACGSKPKDEASFYYLSLKSNSYQVYQSEKDIPEQVKFHSADNQVFTIEIDLNKDEEFTINQIGADEKIGFSALFSALTQLESGENGSFKVNETGTYSLRLNKTENEVSYTFKPVTIVTAPVDGVNLNESEISLDKGDTFTLTATVSPENAEDKGVLWDSEDKTVATVEDGVVTAVGYGSTNITVTTNNGEFTATCKVTVLQHVSSLTLEYTHLKLEVGTTTSLKINFSPIEATNQGYSYTIESGDSFVELSRDENVSALNIKGLAVGDATIIVISDDGGIDAACVVEVVEKNSAFINMPQSLKVTIGQEEKLSVSVNHIENYSISWEVENEDVVMLDGKDETVGISGVNFGSTAVTVTVTHGDTVYTATTDILVTDEYFFIYGIGLVEEGDWSWQNYISDRSAAEDRNLLFTEQSRGLYTLTRYFTPTNGFQIIFPSVDNANLQDENGEWGKNMPSELVSASTYYDSSQSDDALVSNLTTQFRVKYAGNYTVTLDLRDESAKVSIKAESVDVENVSLSVEEGSVLLHGGEAVKLNVKVNPSRATFTEEDVHISLGGQENNFDYELDLSTMTLTVRAKQDVSVCSFVLTCSIKETTGSIELFVIDENVVPVTSLAFEKEAYTFNVNNGGMAWEQQVRALVNQDATVQAVKYSHIGSDSFFSVNEDTGIVTAMRLGTITICATAVGDESITAYCTVTFYSDTFYLVGEFNDLTDFDYVPVSQTSLDGTKFAAYKFTMESPTRFTLTATLEEWKKVGKGRPEYGFQIAHLGMNDSWESAITYPFLDQSGCYNTDLLSPHQTNLRVTQTGVYVLELDLSEQRVSWTINQKEETLHEVFLKSSTTEVKKGESAQIQLTFGPRFAQPTQEIVWSVSQGDGKDYVSLNFDNAKNLCTVTVKDAEFSNDDIPITITCKVGEIEGSVTITVLAEHHLVFESNNESHWQVCTDAECGYSTTPDRHERDDQWDFDGQYHFHACDVCGAGKVDVSEHNFKLYAGGWYIDDGRCSDCGYNLYTVENGTIIKYTGQIAKLQIPSKINGEQITGIGERAFAENLYLIEVELPDTVTEIGDWAFDGCTGLTRIDFGNAAIATIGQRAFKNCSSLISFTIPETVSHIRVEAFSGVSAEIVWAGTPHIITLTQTFQGYLGMSLTIPSSVKALSGACFANCKNLISFVLPDSVENIISGNQFRGCANLKYVEISSSIGELEGSDFEGCTSLEYILLKSSNFWHFGVSAFEGCAALKAVYTRTPLNVAREAYFGYIYSGNTALIGKLYPYSSKESTVLHPDFGTKWAKYFGGTWYYDETGIESLEHVVNGQEALKKEAAPVNTITLICDFKRRESL